MPTRSKMQTFNGLYAITPDTDDSERLIEQVSAVLDGMGRPSGSRQQERDGPR